MCVFPFVLLFNRTKEHILNISQFFFTDIFVMMFYLPSFFVLSCVVLFHSGFVFFTFSLSFFLFVDKKRREVEESSNLHAICWCFCLSDLQIFIFQQNMCCAKTHVLPTGNWRNQDSTGAFMCYWQLATRNSQATGNWRLSPSRDNSLEKRLHKLLKRIHIEFYPVILKLQLCSVLFFQPITFFINRSSLCPDVKWISVRHRQRSN